MVPDATSRSGERPARSATARILLPDDELAAWRSLLRLHARAIRVLESELLTAHGLPLTWYDVLVQLVEAPEHRLRMRDLADLVLISRSGLTRLVDRMGAVGLVARATVDEDARGWWVVLTPAGYERLRAASPTHLRGIHEHVTGCLQPEEARLLAGLLERMTPRVSSTPSAANPSPH